MAIPPPVTAAQAQAAIARIVERRTRIDDPQAELLSDDPGEVLLYLRKYSGPSIPVTVKQADVHDAVILRQWLYWQGEEAELWFLEQAIRVGVPLSSLAAALGVASRQAVHERLRLGRRKREVLLGQPYRGDLGAQDQEERGAEQTWLDRHRKEVLALSAEAVAHRHLGTPEAQEWLDEVARDVRDSAVTPGSLQILRVALGDLATSPAVLEDPPETIVQLLKRWSQLWEDFQAHRR
jgi:hypothetical protein